MRIVSLRIFLNLDLHVSMELFVAQDVLILVYSDFAFSLGSAHLK